MILTVSAFAQTTQKFADGCPPGTHPVYINECDGFNFHRPVTNCKTGFWFCSYGCTGWHWECVPNTTFKATIDQKNVAKVWAQLSGNKIEFHFPSAISALDSYTKEDLSKFTVDEQLVFEFDGKKCKLAIGEYPVKEVNGELIILVDYTII